MEIKWIAFELVKVLNKEFKMIFVPADQEAEIICEVDAAQIFRDIEEVPPNVTVSLKTYEFGGEQYTVNLANIRYQVIKSRKCACCGLIGTRMFLCEFEEDGNQGYNFRLFAESKDQNSVKSHLTLMTRDHIVPKARDGIDSLANSQCLCFLCNLIKGDTNFDVKTLRGILFSAYRVYKATYCLNLTTVALKKYYNRLASFDKAIKNINQGMLRTENEQSIQAMQTKILRIQKQSELYQLKLQEIETLAQSRGKIYFEPELAVIFKKLDELSSQT